jgi:hypothetical protein
MQPPHQLRQLKVAQHHFMEQIRALVVKTALVQSRRPSSMLMFLISPSLFIILLGAVQIAVRKGSGDGVISLGLSKCSGFGVYGQLDTDFPCTTIAFAVNAPTGSRGSNDSLLVGNISNTMRMVASDNNLVYGTDIKQFSSGKAISNAIYDNVGTIDTAVIFRNETSYEVWANMSAAQAYANHGQNPMYKQMGIDGRTVGLQLAVNSALMANRAGRDKSADMRISVAPFTEVKGGDSLSG